MRSCSPNLGDVFAHLDGIVYQSRLGFGTQLLRFGFDGSSPLNADNTVGSLVIEANMNARLTPSLLLDVGYVQRPDTLVGKLSRSIGAFFATLSYDLPARFELYVDGRIGKGFQLVSGVSYYLYR